jgi:ribosome-associated heat shock protein Hsp15
MSSSDTSGQRLDKWLWVARFYKTRSLAAEAVSGGRVHVDGQRVKPARMVRPGSMVRVRRGELEMTVEVQGLATQRRPAEEARLLYAETEASRELREARAAERKALNQSRVTRHAPRPTKRDRRQLERFTGRS